MDSLTFTSSCYCPCVTLWATCDQIWMLCYNRSHHEFVETVPENSLSDLGRDAGHQWAMVLVSRNLSPNVSLLWLVKVLMMTTNLTTGCLLSHAVWSLSQTSCIDMILLLTLARLSRHEEMLVLPEWNFDLTISYI